MPRVCTICNHDEREKIDRALVLREPFRHIASRFDVSTGALQRHMKADLPKLLVKGREAEQQTQADDLLRQVRFLQGRTIQTLQTAEREKDFATLLRAVREARGNVELLGRLRGELDERAQVNVLVNPQWVEIKAVVVGALADHPAARRAVIEGLAELEGDTDG